MNLTEIFTFSVFGASMLFIGIFAYIVIKDAKKNLRKDIQKK